MSKSKSNGKRGYLKPYRSYVFRTKDPAIDLVRTAVQDSKMKHSEISEKSGVSTSAMHGWFYGNVCRPQFATLNATLRAVGKKFGVMDM